MHAFSESDKLAFAGNAEDDAQLFRFNCFNPEDDHDPLIGLEYGELCIPGAVLKAQVFDPVVEQVLALLEHQLGAMPVAVDALLMVGGFAASPYLFRRVQETFGSQVRLILRPQDADVATLRGAARYGLTTGGARVGSIISPRSYCMKVKLPAEQVDRLYRPHFLARNQAGMEVCENRLSYLVVKGAVLRKGERLRSRFCRFVSATESSIFTASLFASDHETIWRWTDEGETRELCHWTVDLGGLPCYADVVKSGGAYVEFDLGLEVVSFIFLLGSSFLRLDSPWARGPLLTPPPGFHRTRPRCAGCCSSRGRTLSAARPSLTSSNGNARRRGRLSAGFVRFVRFVPSSICPAGYGGDWVGAEGSLYF